MKNAVLDVVPAHLAVIAERLAYRLPGTTVRAFGSRVRNWPFGHDSKPYSDLDVAVWTSDTAIDLQLAELRADFEETDLPWRVDVSLARDLPAELRKLVQAHGFDIQCSPSTTS